MTEDVTGIPDSIKPMVWVKDNSVLPIFVRDEYLKDIYDLQIRESDVIIVTWPKSGTTWAQYVVSQIVRGKEFVKTNLLHEDHIFLEHPQNFLDISSDGCYKLADGVKASPRFLKSHLLGRYLPHETLEKHIKVIYVARNPKDAIVSYYHFCLANKMLPTYGWEEIIEQFCSGLLPYGDWFEHVLEWWEKRDEPNVLFIKYEDMKNNFKQVGAQIGKFLDRSLTEDEVNEIGKSSSFENMKKNPKANIDIIGAGIDWKKKEGKHVNFMRKGVIGDWKNWFTVAQSEKLDELYKKKMEGSGLEFPYQ